MTIQVILADDHAMVRDGLRVLLERDPEIAIVAEVGDGASAVRLAEQLSPDIVIMDVGLPKVNGIEATRRICQSRPEVRVIGLSIHGDQVFVEAMLAAGASGFVVKRSAFTALRAAIQHALAGEIFVSPTDTEERLEFASSRSSAPAVETGSTPAASS